MNMQDNKIKHHWFYISLNYYNNGLVHTYGEHISTTRRNINKRDTKSFLNFVVTKKVAINNIIYLGHMTDYEFFFDPNNLDDKYKIDHFFNPSKNLRIR